MTEKDVKDALKSGRLVIGSRSVFRGVKNNTIESVIISVNCPKGRVNDLSYYNKEFGIDLKEFKGSSRKLGEMCGKPFNIIMVGVKRTGKNGNKI